MTYAQVIPITRARRRARIARHASGPFAGVAPRVHYCAVCGRAPVEEPGACHTCKIEMHMTASLSARSRKRIAEYQRAHHCAECGYELGDTAAFNGAGNLIHPGCGVAP